MDYAVRFMWFALGLLVVVLYMWARRQERIAIERRGIEKQKEAQGGIPPWDQLP